MKLPQYDLDDIRQELEAKRAELLAYRTAEGIAIERIADSMDQLVGANERDLVVERLNRETGLLREISGALERIATGEYGTCLTCGDQIAKRRLTALPWAALCIECQENVDRAQGQEERFVQVPESLEAA